MTFTAVLQAVGQGFSKGLKWAVEYAVPGRPGLARPDPVLAARYPRRPGRPPHRVQADGPAAPHRMSQKALRRVRRDQPQCPDRVQ